MSVTYPNIKIQAATDTRGGFCHVRQEIATELSFSLFVSFCNKEGEPLKVKSNFEVVSLQKIAGTAYIP